MKKIKFFKTSLNNKNSISFLRPSKTCGALKKGPNFGSLTLKYNLKKALGNDCMEKVSCTYLECSIWKLKIWTLMQNENTLGVFNQTLLLSKKSLSWRFIYFLSFGSHVQFPDFLPVTLGRLVFFSSTKRASKLAKEPKAWDVKGVLSPNICKNVRLCKYLQIRNKWVLLTYRQRSYQRWKTKKAKLLLNLCKCSVQQKPNKKLSIVSVIKESIKQKWNSGMFW